MNEVFNYIMGTIIVTSILVNSLALCAFLISPGMRTTAHNLVINLLIVNIVGCTILIFSMFNITSVLNSLNSTNNNNNNNNNNTNNYSQPQQDHYNLASFFLNTFSIKNNDNNNNNNDESANITDYDDGFVNMDNTILFNDDYFTTTTTTTESKHTKDVNNELIENFINKTNENLIKQTTKTYARFWGSDLSAALGALSVLLIVGDTWFAVTDPLRYHTRISKPKAWLLIGFAWFLSIIFGIASAFRYNSVLNMVDTSESSSSSSSIPISWIKETINYNLTNQHENINNESTTIPSISLITNYHYYYKYNTVFSYTYFIIIIMLPICFVSLMYWKIYIAAKDNVVRMRKSGSSSLLNHQHHHYSAPVNNGNGNSDNTFMPNQSSADNSDGLTMSIDKQPPKINNTKINQNNNNNNNSNNNNNNHHNSRIGLHSSHHQQKFALLPSIIEHKVSQGKDVLKNLLLLENRGNENLRQVKSTPNLQNQAAAAAVTHSSAEYNNSNNSTSTTPTSPTYCKTMQHLLSIRHRLSNASSNFKYREEIRTARISLMVIIMFFISYFPYGVLVLSQSDVNVGSKENILLIIFVFVAHLCTPFIFAYRNRSVRRGLIRLFRRASANSNITFNSSPKLLPASLTMRRIQSTSTISNHHLHHHSHHRVTRPFSR